MGERMGCVRNDEHNGFQIFDMTTLHDDNIQGLISLCQGLFHVQLATKASVKCFEVQQEEFIQRAII